MDFSLSLLLRASSSMLLHAARHGAAWQLFRVPSRRHKLPALHRALILGVQTAGSGLPSCTCMISCDAFQGRHSSTLLPPGIVWPAILLV